MMTIHGDSDRHDRTGLRRNDCGGSEKAGLNQFFEIFRTKLTLDVVDTGLGYVVVGTLAVKADEKAGFFEFSHPPRVGASGLFDQVSVLQILTNVLWRHDDSVAFRSSEGVHKLQNGLIEPGHPRYPRAHTSILELSSLSGLDFTPERAESIGCEPFVLVRTISCTICNVRPILLSTTDSKGCLSDAPEVELVPTNNGATRGPARMTPRGVAKPNDMNDNDPTAKESVGEAASIAHSVCHDCDEHEQLHSAHRPEDAKQQAVNAAIEHGRATGHDVDGGLVDEPAKMTTTGPDVADTEVVRR